MANAQKFVELSPPPTMVDKFMPRQWATWFAHVFDRLGSGPFGIQGYDRASLVGGTPKVHPRDWASLTATKSFTSIIFVYNEAGGVPCLAYSDGTNWRRVHDNVIVV